MEIKVGEYVRTKKGKIFKYDKGRAYLGKDNEIVKHSFNIAELIKVNDFVNGHRVANIKNDEERIEIGLETDHMINYYIEEQDIKTILTYEQHERNFYILD